ncbi:proline-rich protein 29 isoform X1 [Colius striatus]|uniref:proline-rich protein 29 isoform X1 n=1 Tax=Colius striatus TaxID=57412 RepID=UPI002B1E3FE9|nr:proline-rich protein 29 isoform X1 [Colius striatus]
MEVGASGDPHGVWGDPSAGTYIIPPRVPTQPPQQPLLILQQLPRTLVTPSPPSGAPQLQGDLIELMMIQSSQMHQVVMNSLAVSALMAFGFGPAPDAAQVMPLETDEEEEAVVFHHHYLPYPRPAPLLAWAVPGQAEAPLGTGWLPEDQEVSAVPPPPPPSATGTVGANVPPASEYYDVVEERL